MVNITELLFGGFWVFSFEQYMVISVLLNGAVGIDLGVEVILLRIFEVLDGGRG